jgi:hypothetical protein
MNVSQDRLEALTRLHGVVLLQMHEGQGPEVVAKVLFEHLQSQLAAGHLHAELARKQVRQEVRRIIGAIENKTFNSALTAFGGWLNKCRDAFLKEAPDLRSEVESRVGHANNDSTTPIAREPDGVACIEAVIDGLPHLVFVLLRTTAHSILLDAAFQPIGNAADQRERASRSTAKDVSPLVVQSMTDGTPQTLLHTCDLGSDERRWLKERLAESVASDDTSDLVLAWINVNPSFFADDARTFFLREAAAALKMTVESVYDVYGQHDMLVKLRGDVAEKQILATLLKEMGQRGFLGRHKGNSYLKPPTVLDIIKEHVALDAPNTRRILCGIIAFVYLSDIPAAHVDDAVDLVRGVVSAAPSAELIGLFQTNRDVVAEVYLACGGYYDLGRAVFAIEKQLNFTSYEAKRTTLLAMSVLEPGDLPLTTNSRV